MRDVSQGETILDITHCLRRIIKSLQDYSSKVYGNLEITGPQLWVLKTVHQNGRLSLGELSKRMYVHPSTLTASVDRLEKKKYLSRSRDDKDRRIINVRLTPKGYKLAKRAPNPIQGKMVVGLRKLRKEELHLIHESMDKLLKIMEAE